MLGAILSEFSIVVLFLLVIGLFIKLVNLSKDVGYLRRQIKRMEERLNGQLASGEVGVVEEAVADKSSTTASVPVAKIEVIEPDEEEVWEEFSDTAVAPVGDQKKDKTSWEQNIGTKLPVWIGSVALIFAAFYMVKYSIEVGLISPAVRLSLGALFGVTLVAGGNWLVQRKAVANGLRISQGMVGAGLVALYFCIYAAAKLYEFIPELLAFGGMSVVTIVGMVMALRHGQVIAGFALVGGLLTPALLSSGEGNVVGLFAYLFILTGCVMGILVRQGNWILGGIAVVGAYLWVFLWIVLSFREFDAFILTLFALGVCGQVLVMTAKYIQQKESEDGLSKDERLQVHGLNFVALVGGIFTVLWLSEEVVLGMFEWAVLGLFSAGLMFLSYFRPDIYLKPLYVKMAVTFGTMVFWIEQANFLEQVLVVLSFSALYIVVPLFVMKRSFCPKLWSVLQCFGALALFLVAYAGMDMPIDLIKSFDGFWGILAFAMAAGFIYLVQEVQWKFGGADEVRDYMVAAYGFTASAFISLGISIVLPWEYIPMAFAGQVLASSWIFSQVRINFLKHAILILAVVTFAMHFEQFWLMSGFVLDSIFNSYSRYSEFDQFVLNDFFFKLGFPVALLSGAAAYYAKASDVSDKAFRVVCAVAASGAMALLYYVVRWIFTFVGESSALFEFEAGFFERAAITSSFFGVYLGLRYGVKNHISPKLLKALLYLVIARFVYFDLLIHNPYWDGSQLVGEWILFNGVTVVYGAALALSLAAVAKLYTPKWLYTGLAVVSLFAFVSLTVAQYFHGMRLSDVIASDIEFYAYSVAWLLAGVGLLAFGIQRQEKPVRLASMGFMVLTVVKVFIFDAAELQGLYRVLSFLGLGLSLMGLSYFYHRYVFQSAVDRSSEQG